MSYETSTVRDKTITFDIRMNMFLLVQTNFEPSKQMDLILKLVAYCDEIIKLDNLGQYDEQTGYIIFLIKKDVDQKRLFKSVHKIFKQYCK